MVNKLYFLALGIFHTSLYYAYVQYMSYYLVKTLTEEKGLNK